MPLDHLPQHTSVPAIFAKAQVPRPNLSSIFTDRGEGRPIEGNTAPGTSVAPSSAAVFSNGGIHIGRISQVTAATIDSILAPNGKSHRVPEGRTNAQQADGVPQLQEEAFEVASEIREARYRILLFDAGIEEPKDEDEFDDIEKGIEEAEERLHAIAGTSPYLAAFVQERVIPMTIIAAKDPATQLLHIMASQRKMMDDAAKDPSYSGQEIIQTRSAKKYEKTRARYDREREKMEEKNKLRVERKRWDRVLATPEGAKVMRHLIGARQKVERAKEVLSLIKSEIKQSKDPVEVSMLRARAARIGARIQKLADTRDSADALLKKLPQAQGRSKWRNKKDHRHPSEAAWVASQPEITSADHAMEVREVTEERNERMRIENAWVDEWAEETNWHAHDFGKEEEAHWQDMELHYADWIAEGNESKDVPDFDNNGRRNNGDGDNGDGDNGNGDNGNGANDNGHDVYWLEDEDEDAETDGEQSPFDGPLATW